MESRPLDSTAFEPGTEAGLGQRILGPPELDDPAAVAEYLAETQTRIRDKIVSLTEHGTEQEVDEFLVSIEEFFPSPEVGSDLGRKLARLQMVESYVDFLVAGE